MLANVEPHHYDGPAFPPDEPIDPGRDALVLPLVRACIAERVPVFGICRGIQEINVALGGSLHYRIHQLPGKNDHRRPRSEDVTQEEVYRLKHTVRLTPGGMFQSLAGRDEMMVNSLHGQGVDRLGKGLVVEAMSPDGVIEGVRYDDETQFIVGVQWHAEWQPEEHALSGALYTAFGEAARARAARRASEVENAHPEAPMLTSHQIESLVARIEPDLIALRRRIHEHPELAFEEHETARAVSDYLSALDIPHRTGVGKTGVVAMIEGGAAGPTVGVRADMDALPIEEASGVPFASRVPGKMHACGHDVHTTIALGVAHVLAGARATLPGRVKLIFQPAEETLSGAAAMIADGVLDDPAMDAIIGFHNSPRLETGLLGTPRAPATLLPPRSTSCSRAGPGTRPIRIPGSMRSWARRSS